MIVKRLREKHNWSQEQLARVSGLSLRTIQRVEAGNRASLDTLKSLASVFDVEISKLTEEIIVIDKHTEAWQSEPLIIRFLLIGLKKRSHMLYLEYCFLLVGLVTWIAVQPLQFITPLAFLFAYGNAKVISHIDKQAHW